MYDGAAGSAESAGAPPAAASTAPSAAASSSAEADEAAERTLLEGMFDLKAEQAACYERQLWTDTQLLHAGDASGLLRLRASGGLPRKRRVVAPRRPPAARGPMGAAADAALAAEGAGQQALTERAGGGARPESDRLSLGRIRMWIWGN